MSRPVGSKNSKTEEWEIFRMHCLSGGLKKFQEELGKLEKRDYVESFIKLLEFHKPKLARTDGTIETVIKQSLTKEQAQEALKAIANDPT